MVFNHVITTILGEMTAVGLAFVALQRGHLTGFQRGLKTQVVGSVKISI